MNQFNNILDNKRIQISARPYSRWSRKSRLFHNLAEKHLWFFRHEPLLRMAGTHEGAWVRAARRAALGGRLPGKPRESAHQAEEQTEEKNKPPESGKLYEGFFF
jgi:hypothetical protein